MSTWLLLGFAFLTLILIPFAPLLVRLRIKFLRWLHWNWAVNLLEGHFQGKAQGKLTIAALALSFCGDPLSLPIERMNQRPKLAM